MRVLRQNPPMSGMMIGYYHSGIVQRTLKYHPKENFVSDGMMKPNAFSVAKSMAF